MRGNYELAGILIGIAMILDTLDGRIARLTHTASEFGVQLRFSCRCNHIRFCTRNALLSMGIFEF